MSGATFETFAAGLAGALDAFSASVVLTGQATGLAGVGAITGTLITPSNVGLCSTALAGSGLEGVIAPNLAILLSNVISTAFTRPYTGTSPTIASGVDNTLVSFSDTALLNQLLLVYWGVRPLTSGLASATAMAVQYMLTFSVGVGTVTGTPSFPPTTLVGVTTSRI